VQKNWKLNPKEESKRKWDSRGGVENVETNMQTVFGLALA
jgi:hypothetical protein